MGTEQHKCCYIRYRGKDHSTSYSTLKKKHWQGTVLDYYVRCIRKCRKQGSGHEQMPPAWLEREVYVTSEH
jgi:hypothetical protein